MGLSFSEFFNDFNWHIGAFNVTAEKPHENQIKINRF